MMHDKRIALLKTGIVIDHILPYKALAVIELLGLTEDRQGLITIGMGLESKKLGKKDIIHVENRTLSDKELSVIALVSPGATINVLEDYIVVKKSMVALPDDLIGLLHCPNANCITNKERLQTRFHRVDHTAACHYCEQTFSLEKLEILR